MNHTITIGLSKQAIATEIYAASALRTVLHPGPSGQRPPLLTADHRPALDRVIRDAYCRTVMRLIGHIADLDASFFGSNASPDDDNDIITIDFHRPRALSDKQSQNLGQVLGQAIQHLIAGMSLHLVHSGHDDTLAERYLAIFDDTLADTLRLLAGTAPVAKIRSHLF